MQDQELIALCKTIYRRHREAIDVIVQYGRATRFEEVANQVLGQSGEFEVLSSSPSAVWFLPVTWAKVLPENGAAWKHLRRNVSVVCWFTWWRSKVDIILEMSKMDDPKLRLACAQALKEAGFRLSKAAFREDATYSRFHREARKVDDFSDEEQLRKAFEALLAHGRELFPKAELVFAKVFAKGVRVPGPSQAAETP
jgi:hypothetical protein